MKKLMLGWAGFVGGLSASAQLVVFNFDGSVGNEAGYGPAEVPLVDLTPAEVTWERDAEARPPTLRVAFDYERTVTWPLLDRTDDVTMSVEIEQDIEPPNWGPSR